MLDFIIIEKIYYPIVIIIVSILIYLSVSIMIRKTFLTNKNKNDIRGRRKITLAKLTINILKYIIFIIAILILLSFYGVNINAILAGLGVAGLIIGLAFQDILKDFLAGIFIILDNQYWIGEVVKYNNFTGEVIEIGLRTTKIKSHTGEVLIIANRNVVEIINCSIYDSLAITDINVSIDSDIDKVEKVITKTLKEIKENNKNITGEVKLLGVQSVSDNILLYRVTALCKPNEQFGIQREILKSMKIAFEKNNIEIPISKVVMKNE